MRFIEVEPDAVFWYQAFLNYDQKRRTDEREASDYRVESMRSLMWIGNMVRHSGSLTQRFMTNNKSRDDIGMLYMPKPWLENMRQNDTEALRKKRDDEVAESLRSL